MRNKHRIERITTVDWKNYKLQLIKNKTATNIHHILGQSLFKQWYAVQAPVNKIKVNEIWHDNLNRFFWWRQSVHQQLLYMLKEWWWERVLSESVKNELYWLLSLPRNLFYREELIRSWYWDKWLFSEDTIDLYKEKI